MLFISPQYLSLNTAIANLCNVYLCGKKAEDFLVIDIASIYVQTRSVKEFSELL